MEKILVTGSSGFIGMHLCKDLLNDGYVVKGIDNMNDYYSKKLKEDRIKNIHKNLDEFAYLIIWANLNKCRKSSQ